MKLFARLAIVFSLICCVSCSQKKDAELGEKVVIIDDDYKTASADKIVIDESSFAGFQTGDAGQQRSAYQEQTRINSDNSKITTMFDGYGNKTETRYFDNNPLLQSVTVRTSAAGEKLVSVYAQNGTVNQLPENMFDRVLSAPANDLAAAAGVFEGRREPVLVQSNQPPLQPMPSYKFPIQMAPAQPIAPEEAPVEPPAAETLKPPVETENPPKQTAEKTASKTPVDDQN